MVCVWCMHVCLCVHVRMHQSAHLYMYVHVEARCWLWVSASLVLHLTFWDKFSSPNPKPSIRQEQAGLWVWNPSVSARSPSFRGATMSCFYVDAVDLNASFPDDATITLPQALHLLFWFILFFWERVSLCSSGWTGICCVDLAGLELSTCFGLCSVKIKEGCTLPCLTVFTF